MFEIVIQTGAMLAIVWEYRARFTRVLGGLAGDRAAQRFAANLVVAFIPAAVLGLAFSSRIKAHLFSPVPVAIAFIVGGLRHPVGRAARAAAAQPARVQSVEDMNWVDALKVGCAQCFALIPGTSRSGATIIGGMIFGLSRRAATEFSFFLAVPTLMAAGAYDLLKHRALFSSATSAPFATGLCGFVRLRLAVRALADPLHRDARLPAVRVVSHRFWIGCACHRLGRLGRLEALSQDCVQGSPALRQPLTVLRWPRASLSPSNPSSTL